MHRFFAIMAVCGVGSVTASTLAQTHRSAEVVIASTNPGAFKSSPRLGQDDTFTMLPSVLSSRLSPYGTGPQNLETSTACVLFPDGTIVPNCISRSNGVRGTALADTSTIRTGRPAYSKPRMVFLPDLLAPGRLAH